MKLLRALIMGIVSGLVLLRYGWVEGIAFLLIALYLDEIAYRDR